VPGADSARRQVVRIEPQPDDSVWRWIVQSRVDGAWHTAILSASQRTHILGDDLSAADAIAVTAVDRSGNTSAATVVLRPR
jgi:hypothetical protein